MSDDLPGDEPDRPDESPPDHGRSSERGWLSNLLTTLERLESVAWTDRRQSERSVVDYSISARSALEDLQSRRADDARRHDAATERARTSSHRARTRRRYEPSVDSTVTARTYDDELLVTADLTGVDPDEITVGFDGPALVIGVDGHELERVQTPWEATSADAAIRNGILTVRVEPITHE
ncbi:Hsp20/alpha crystallin family protein [Natronobeatus ordinarius]|uniref:Hsp20/alpha crystallin family protein n=1 Tax=Natronobeatus ordinarius TaxID=2963433 RepID=UPI0020CD6034|nr:Hsp20/alpha crystallin family protein [Natronobeatus ordinarius]